MKSHSTSPMPNGGAVVDGANTTSRHSCGDHALVRVCSIKSTAVTPAVCLRSRLRRLPISPGGQARPRGFPCAPTASRVTLIPLSRLAFQSAPLARSHVPTQFAIFRFQPHRNRFRGRYELHCLPTSYTHLTIASSKPTALQLIPQSNWFRKGGPGVAGTFRLTAAGGLSLRVMSRRRPDAAGQANEQERARPAHLPRLSCLSGGTTRML